MELTTKKYSILSNLILHKTYEVLEQIQEQESGASIH